MAQFSNRQYGNTWLRNPFTHLSPNKEREIHDILLECFQPAPLWTKSTSSRTGIRVVSYQPNLVARKFSLSKLIPKSLIPEEDVILFSTDEPSEKWLKSCKDFFGEKNMVLNCLEFSLSFHCTKEFKDWWSLYYQGSDPFLLTYYRCFPQSKIVDRCRSRNEHYRRESPPPIPLKNQTYMAIRFADANFEDQRAGIVESEVPKLKKKKRGGTTPHQLVKSKHVDMDLIQTIKDNQVILIEIQGLLLKLNKSEALDSFVDFTLDFEPLLEQNVQSQGQIVELEANVKGKNRPASLAADILSWTQQMNWVYMKIEATEKETVEINVSEPAFVEEKLVEEANVGIECANITRLLEGGEQTKG
ncbi:hypothetical protein KIW84_013400 [Lathyrus oleraceus]|uniref:Uncharacterized protein n=1 Tax=Pisum sativum TaxID=3888 RepID=A0A9D5BKB9_PEA|nr:hypothetical protein KIW84_013400 [Pisum sativum]